MEHVVKKNIKKKTHTHIQAVSIQTSASRWRWKRIICYHSFTYPHTHTHTHTPISTYMPGAPPRITKQCQILITQLVSHDITQPRRCTWRNPAHQEDLIGRHPLGS